VALSIPSHSPPARTTPIHKRAHDPRIGGASILYDPPVLVATWILAIATSILAVSGPVALLVWPSGRRADRDQRERGCEEEARNRILKNARDEFVPKSWVAGVLVAAALAALVAWSSWTERKAPGRRD
jgi:hypothetical protein